MAKTPTKIAIKFTRVRLTHYGGAYLLHQFFQRLQLRKRMSHVVRLPDRNMMYYSSEFLLTLVYPIIFGLGRIEATQFLKYNGLFRFLTGLRSHPDATTLRRFLLRLGPKGLSRLLTLHDRYRQQLLNRPEALSKFYFDCDSTVLTVYGQQEKARKGYNPKKPGRHSLKFIGSVMRLSRIEPSRSNESLQDYGIDAYRPILRSLNFIISRMAGSTNIVLS